MALGLADYGSDEKLCGATAMEKATVSMWLRRVEQHIVLPMYGPHVHCYVPLTALLRTAACAGIRLQLSLLSASGSTISAGVQLKISSPKRYSP